MPTVKLCTYTRGFYPTVWGYRTFTAIGMYLVIVDGKVIKRSFSELAYTKEGEYCGEFDALRAGLEWITDNMKDLRDTNIQVLFCGSHRSECKKIVDEKLPFPTGGGYECSKGTRVLGINELVKKFNKVEYYSVSRVTINNGENDDPEQAERFDMYGTATKIFEILYGDSGFNHLVVDDVVENGIQKKVLVGEPELRWTNGVPKNIWKWS